MKRSNVKPGMCIWIALLLCLFNVGIEGRACIALGDDAQPYDATSTISATGHKTLCGYYTAVQESPADNILEAKRASNRLATPTSTITLQGARRTSSVVDALQRTVRSQGAAQAEQNNNTLHQSSTTVQTISSKRFHTGYYIYHRCQMRC